MENLESERVNFSSTLLVLQCERNNFQSFQICLVNIIYIPLESCLETFDIVLVFQISR